jgi:hypothetical protein
MLDLVKGFCHTQNERRDSPTPTEGLRLGFDARGVAVREA